VIGVKPRRALQKGSNRPRERDRKPGHRQAHLTRGLDLTPSFATFAPRTCGYCCRESRKTLLMSILDRLSC
jgi:hypothetical protein